MSMPAPIVETPVLSLEIPALAELAGRRQWVCWHYVQRDGEWTKAPLQATGIGASSTNPHTWGEFRAIVQAAMTSGHGVGYVFDGDVVGVDLDKCRNPKTGDIEAWAIEAVERLASYTEISPSGRGLHVICRGKIPRDGGRKGKVEIYTRGRYFTFTGQHLAGTPDNIRDADANLDWLWSTYIRLGLGPDTERQFDSVSPGEFPWEKFDALLENDPKFRKTWLHKRPDLEDQSLSVFDFSLCVMAAQAGWDDAELAALVVHHRRKWGGLDKSTKRKDYVARTVGNAREVLRRRSEGNESLAAATASVAARERAEETLENGQEAALDELRSRLGLPLARVVITGELTAISYWLVLDDDRRIGLGSPGRVLEQATMRRAAFAAVGKVIPMVKQPMWDATVMVLQAAAEREDAADSDPVREVNSMIEEYGEQYPAPDWSSENADGEFEKNRPLRRGGIFMISPREFLRWAQAKGALLAFRLEDVRSTLRSDGWIGEDVPRRVGGKVKCRTYWSHYTKHYTKMN